MLSIIKDVEAVSKKARQDDDLGTEHLQVLLFLLLEMEDGNNGFWRSVHKISLLVNICIECRSKGTRMVQKTKSSYLNVAFQKFSREKIH